MKYLCGQLDVYLLGELATGDRFEFERHLKLCESCQGAVAQQRSIDACCRDASGAPSPLPDYLATRVRRGFDRARRRSQAVWASSVLVPVIALAATGLWVADGYRPVPRSQPIVEAGTSGGSSKVPLQEPDLRQSVDTRQKVKIELSEGMLGVHTESGHDDVTLIEVFSVGSATAAGE